MRRYQGSLLRYARCSLGTDEALDVVQEVFLRLHGTLRKNNMANIDGVGSWLFKVAHNYATDVLRKSRRTSKVMETATANAVAGAAETPDGPESSDEVIEDVPVD